MQTKREREREGERARERAEQNSKGRWVPPAKRELELELVSQIQ